MSQLSLSVILSHELTLSLLWMWCRDDSESTELGRLQIFSVQSLFSSLMHLGADKLDKHSLLYRVSSCVRLLHPVVYLAPSGIFKEENVPRCASICSLPFQTAMELGWSFILLQKMDSIIARVYR
jgi:hypothetical protein